MNSRRAFWSVVPEQTNSPYIRDVAGSLRSAGWTIEPLNVRTLAATSEEIVHIQWPEHVSRGASTPSTVAKHLRAIPLLAALKLRNHRVVLTAHNRAPHGASDAVDAWFRSALESIAHTAIVLVPGHEAELERMGAIGATTRVCTIAHPIHVPKTPVEFTEKRDLLLVLGQIHPYHLIEEFLERFDPEVCPYDVLVTGGVGDDAVVERLQAKAARNDWLTVIPGFADDEALSPHLERCAAMVSLQRNTFNSGGPFFALPRNLPIIMTSGPQADDLIDTVGPEWVFPVSEPAQFECAELNAWLKLDRSTPDLERFTLENITDAHIELYELLRS